MEGNNWTFDRFHLMFNFKTKVSHDVFTNKKNVNWHLHLLQCHLNVTCLVICVISNSNVQLTCVFYFTCRIWRCGCQLTCIFVECKFLHVQRQNPRASQSLECWPSRTHPSMVYCIFIKVNLLYLKKIVSTCVESWLKLFGDYEFGMMFVAYRWYSDCIARDQRSK